MSLTRGRFETVLFTLAIIVFGTPAFAQFDLAGMWAPLQHQDWMERGSGPDIVDYIGMPLNEEARQRALMHDYSGTMAHAERQCGYYTPFYNMKGPQALKIWSENDPVRGREIVAWHLSGFVDVDHTTIYMDGRPRPSENALHPYGGFITGEWQGDVLATYATHLKAGYIRRNGTPSSDQATMRQWIFRHGDLLTITSMVEDPVFLTEPYVVSRVWQLDPRGQTPTTWSACEPIVENPRLEGSGIVPHYLPGKNPFVNELSKIYGLPLETVLGGAATMYPEYRKVLRDKYVRPEKCARYCGQGIQPQR